MGHLDELSKYQSMFRLDPDGLEQLRNAEQSDLVTQHVCPNGAKVVCYAGRKLHSGRDPALEAKRFSRQTDLSATNLLLVFGYASGYAAQALALRDEVEVVVYEPSIDLLREGIFHNPPCDNLQIITSFEALEAYYDSRLKETCYLQVLAWPSSARLFPNEHTLVTALTKSCAERLQLLHNTSYYRTQGWLNNYLTNMSALSRYANPPSYRGQFSNHPAIICAAGPSLTTNAQLIKSLKGHCIVIAVNTAARALAKMGIKPHIVICVESLDVSMQLKDISWINEVTAFLELTGHPALFKLGFGNIVPMSVASSTLAEFTRRFGQDQVFQAGQCVANAAVALASYLGCPGIVLLGQDLAYKDDRVYADGTVFDELRVSIEDGQSKLSNTQAKDQIQDASPGVFSKDVKTKYDYKPVKLPAWGAHDTLVQSNEGFASFLRWFAEGSKVLRQEGKWIVNATQGGAHIPGWDEMTFEDAITQYKLDRPVLENDSDPDSKLELLAKRPPLPIDLLVKELERERDGLLEIMSIVLSTRALVGDDPDGDVFANPDVAARIHENLGKIREFIAQCQLFQCRVNHPLTDLTNRHQINTFTLTRLLEQESKDLIQTIGTVLDSLDIEVSTDRVAS